MRVPNNSAVPPPLPPPCHRYVSIAYADSAGAMSPADAVLGWVDDTTGVGMVDTFYITSGESK